MTSAEFTMLRHLLGITVEDVAGTFHVSLGSVRRWDVTHPPPQPVVAWLRGKLAAAKTAVQLMLEQIDAEARLTRESVATLPMYRTDAQAHTALGPEITKAQHAALMGLVAFLGAEEFALTAAYVAGEA